MPASADTGTITTTGLPTGAIKHVWLIILENKSYDENFTGLNQNSYLWQTLPSQGALLTNYYGTGHFSQDNYISLVSGQSPSYDLQDDCATSASMVNNDSGIITTGTVGTTSDTDGTHSAGSLYTNTPSPTGAANGNYGQILTHGGVDAALGNNGCVYPDQVATLFNQFNAAGVSWKGYAQDLGGAQPVGATSYVTGSAAGVSDTVPNRDDGVCGYPGATSNAPLSNPTALTAPSSTTSPAVSSYTAAQPANAVTAADTSGNGDPADQYVAKHFPLPWFTGLTGAQSAGGTQNSVSYSASGAINEPSSDLPGEATGGSPTNCDASHVANLDDPTYGLHHDLYTAGDTPAFSWITPNNCSDAHDASCQGNNLSGAFDSSGNPVYTPSGFAADDPEAVPPANYTGGLYAADLFLKYYVGMIEASPAWQQGGGLIDVTFDEANPPFTIGNSFNNVKAPGDTGTLTPADQPTFGTAGSTAPGANSLFGAYGLASDLAGENINGQNVSTEPTGPNDPEVTDGSGNQLQPGPGASGFIDRAKGLTGESANLSTSPGIASEPASFSPSSSMINDPKINADDTGRVVTGTGIPAGAFVGAVTNNGPLYLSGNTNTNGASNNFAKPWTGTFQLVNDQGNPVLPTASATNADPTGSGASNITLSAEGGTSNLGTTNCPNGSETATACTTTDPLYDATDFTPGGGDTGSVLISPYITPGTVSSTYYNHYSWLRTMEDLFLTGASCNNVTLTAGTICGGLDGQGHIGYAAQAGLAPFGPDVFTNAGAPAQTPEAPLAVGIPLAAMASFAGYMLWSRRRRARVVS
ncbi:MAG TPA: hypothetical protein VG435_17700 [Acidimicrobiales bacterium]|nr:hypothetical protein [Acidimicrobiales bacterium]